VCVCKYVYVCVFVGVCVYDFMCVFVCVACKWLHLASLSPLILALPQYVCVYVYDYMYVCST